MTEHLPDDITGGQTDAVQFVFDNPASGQTITFTDTAGKRTISCSYQESGMTRVITLTDAEAAEIVAWKNSGRRNSFWNWPGWAAAQARNTSA